MQTIDAHETSAGTQSSTRGILRIAACWGVAIYRLTTSQSTKAGPRFPVFATSSKVNDNYRKRTYNRSHSTATANFSRC